MKQLSVQQVPPRNIIVWRQLLPHQPRINRVHQHQHPLRHLPDRLGRVVQCAHPELGERAARQAALLVCRDAVVDYQLLDHLRSAERETRVGAAAHGAAQVDGDDVQVSVECLKMKIFSENPERKQDKKCSYLTVLQSAIVRIVCTAMWCIRALVSPDFVRSSGKILSTLRDTSAGETLINQ